MLARLLEAVRTSGPDVVLLNRAASSATRPSRVHYDGGAALRGADRAAQLLPPLAAAKAKGVVEVGCAVSHGLLRLTRAQLGGFDERYFILFEDLGLSYPSARSGRTRSSVEDALVRHLGGTSGISFREDRAIPLAPRLPARATAGSSWPRTTAPGRSCACLPGSCCTSSRAWASRCSPARRWPGCAASSTSWPSSACSRAAGELGEVELAAHPGQRRAGRQRGQAWLVQHGPGEAGARRQALTSSWPGRSAVARVQVDAARIARSRKCRWFARCRASASSTGRIRHPPRAADGRTGRGPRRDEVALVEAAELEHARGQRAGPRPRGPPRPRPGLPPRRACKLPPTISPA